MLCIMAERPDFDNPSLWEIHDDINVFAEHKRVVQTRDGKKRTITYDKDRLKRVARNSNERDRIRQPCPLVLGHTDDDRPEHEQPDIVGYARKYRVVYDDLLKK